MNLLKSMEQRLQYLWKDYLKNIKDQSKSKVLLAEYRKVYESLKKQRIITQEIGR